MHIFSKKIDFSPIFLSFFKIFTNFHRFLANFSNFPTFLEENFIENDQYRIFSKKSIFHRFFSIFSKCSLIYIILYRLLANFSNFPSFPPQKSIENHPKNLKSIFFMKTHHSFLRNRVFFWFLDVH